MSLIDNVHQIAEDENETAQLQREVEFRAKQEKFHSTTRDFLRKYFKEASSSILLGAPTSKPGNLHNLWRVQNYVPILGANEKHLKVAVMILEKDNIDAEVVRFVKKGLSGWKEIDALDAAKIIIKKAKL